MALMTWTIMPIDAPGFDVLRLDHQAGVGQ
jgi:hypothetical protein